jgi:hypothetical protein
LKDQNNNGNNNIVSKKQRILSFFLIIILISSTLVITLGPSPSSLFATPTVNDDGINGLGESTVPQQIEVEDCIAFDPAQATLQNVQGSWKVVVGDMWMLDFADNQANAQKALDIIRHYKLSEQCFVGRPNPPMQYYLTNSMNGTIEAPKGPSLPGGGEDCVSFNPQSITVEQIAGTWKVVDGDHWILDFGASQDNANKALQIIKKYNFDHICFVGRPGLEMMYFVTTSSSAPPTVGELFASEPVTPISPETDLSNENLSANNLTTTQPAEPGDPIGEIPEFKDEETRLPNVARPQTGAQVPDEGTNTSNQITDGLLRSSIAHGWSYLLEGIKHIWKMIGDFTTNTQHGSYSAYATPAFSTPVVNFEGIPAALVPELGFVPYPPDTVGDVGPNHYIQAVNSQFAIFDKNGNTLAGPFFLNQPWVIAADQGLIDPSDPCVTNNDGDPFILYDHLADRWLLSQFVTGTAAGVGWRECIAISRTPDPVSGGWHLYDFDTGGIVNDYPHFGLWPDAYYMSTNVNHPSGHAWAFDRANMLSGNPATFIRFPVTGALSSFMLPSDLDGPAPPTGAPNVFMRFVDGAEMTGADRLEMFEFHVDFTNPTLSSFTALPDLTTTIDSSLCGLDFFGVCVPQLGTSQMLETLRPWLMNRMQYRNFGGYETLVVNHSVDVNGADLAGIRWYELRKVGGSWSIFQQGNHSPDSTHRWMGSIAMNKDGHIALGYSTSSSTESPSIRYAGRLASDPLGALPQGEFDILVGGGSQEFYRWGDYSAMTVDPVDDCTFWYTTEYFNPSTGHWGTRIAAFRFSDCNSPPDCTTATPSQSVLWPPNHRMIGITIQNIVDPDGDPLTIRITSIRQDEPTRGQGTGDQSPDGFGIGTSTAQVRAERAGTGDGRVYHIGFTANDGRGGECTGEVLVSVPHDQRGAPAVDSGAVFDSTQQ